MNRVEYLNKIINDNNLEKCVEIGVWKGETSFKLCTNSIIHEYYMVDPHSYEDNCFEFSGEDHPPFMKEGMYQCTMGGPVLTQNELDIIANDIAKKCKKYENIFYLRKTSLEASKEFEDNYFDFIYLDGIHLYENVKEDIIHWIPKLKKGGFFVGDDYSKNFPGVIKAVNEMFENNLDNLEIDKNLQQYCYHNV